MAPTPPTAKAERLLNLVIALLNTRQFRSAAWIRRQVAGYGDAPSDDAFSRMFERDKTELRELTVPLETDGNDGYRIPPNEFSLPELTFTPEETAAVGLAARLWSTTSLASAGEQGLRKLREAGSAQSGRDPDPSAPGFARTDTVLQPRVRTSDPAFGPLQAATLARRQVRFDYRKRPDDAPVKRRLQPWGLVSFRGRWYLIGYDLDRKGQRTFRLSRIAGVVSATGKAGAYSVPAEVDLLEQVRKSATPVVERMARVRVRPGRAIGLRREAELISAASTATAAIGDGASAASFTADAAFDVLRIPMTGLWDTARRVVANGPDVQVVDPPDLRDAVVRLLRGAMGAADR
ncbi:MAG: helix-turn-helix transcriptional regulator [Nakamurella sp.]